MTALHLDKSTKTTFQIENKVLRQALFNITFLDYTQWYDWLQAKQYPTLIYVGQWDMRDGVISQHKWLRNSYYLGNFMWEDSRRIYLVNDTISQSMKIGGYWRTDQKNLITLFTLPKSGHSALREQVMTLNQLIEDMTS